LLTWRTHSAAVNNAQPHNQTAISVSARIVGRFTEIRSTRGLALAGGKGTILSLICILLFKEKTPARGEKLQNGKSVCPTKHPEFQTTRRSRRSRRFVAALLI